MSPVLHDLTALLGDIEDLRARTTAAQAGPGLLDVADAARSLASAITSSPVLTTPPEGDWVALSDDGAPIVVGPDFMLDSSPSGLSLQSGDVNWFVSTSGPTRVLVSEMGSVVADWTFSPTGEAIDNLDFDEAFDLFEQELDAAVENAIVTSGVRDFDDGGASETDAPPVTVSGEVFTATDTAPAATASDSSGGGLSGVGAIGTIGTVVGGIAAREISRHLRRGGEAEADRATPAWQPTHVVGAQPLPVGGVPAGTFETGTTLDPGLEVRLIETSADGWALVECSNTWRCYVAAWGLVEISR